MLFMVLMLFLFHEEVRSLGVIPDDDRMQTLCHSLSYLNFDKNDHKDSHIICTKKSDSYANFAELYPVLFQHQVVNNSLVSQE